MTPTTDDVAGLVAGPCVICGATNYRLSCGGPTICPKCDCGHFDAATVEHQARVIAGLRYDLESQAKALRDWQDSSEAYRKDYEAAEARAIAAEAERDKFRLEERESFQKYVDANEARLAAEARLKEAEAEIDQAKDMLGDVPGDTLHDRINRLIGDYFGLQVEFDRATAAEARLKEAEKDAERYRYLRERDLDTIDKGGVFAGMTPKNVILNLEDLDREVDAARAFLNAGEK